MEFITVESQVFKDLTAKINTIARFVVTIHNDFGYNTHFTQIRCVKD